MKSLILQEICLPTWLSSFMQFPIIAKILSILSALDHLQAVLSDVDGGRIMYIDVRYPKTIIKPIMACLSALLIVIENCIS